MNPTQELSNIGQSIWLDNITRDMLDDGTLSRYINEFSVTGLTSNPTIFFKAIANTRSYDDAIRRPSASQLTNEDLFFELALQDLTRAADRFLPVYQRTGGADGFVSLEVSPLLAHDAERSTMAALDLHEKANRSNLFIKIPGTAQGNQAIEDAVAAGVPINVTLLFSKEQYLASANAYIRGMERRAAAGLSLDIPSVASLFISRWDQSIAGKVAPALRNTLGIAVGQQVYKAYCDLLDSERWQRIAALGAKPQRLLFASTGTKDPTASDFMYVAALAAPNTINTIPEKTLLAFREHGRLAGVLPRDGGASESVLENFENIGIDVAKLAVTLQAQGTESFNESWRELLAVIQAKSAKLLQTA
jgi:transaldolase